MDIDKIIESGKKFYKVAEYKGNDRFNSWKYCYDSFKDTHNRYINNKVNDLEKELDNLCLQLSFYLASWGMYRGSSFLIWQDYKVHYDVVKEIICNSNYNILWNIRLEDYVNNKENCIGKLGILIDFINNHYLPIRKDVLDFLKVYKPKKYNKNENSDNNKVSDTLISKIILGTIGCVPAYDRYFIIGIRNSDNLTTTVFNGKSIQKLAKNCLSNSAFIDKFNNLKKEFLDYTEMKLIDSCFWQYGYDIDNEKNS